MSTITKTQPQVVRVPSKPNMASSGNPETQMEQSFLFDKDNYMWMIGGICLIFLGFFLMAGGKSANPHEFHYDEIYSFRRITLAPIVILIGFTVEVFAIMRKPKENASVA